MKSNKILLSVFAFLILFSCKKQTYEDQVASEYNSVVLFQKFGEQNVDLYNTGDDAIYEFTILKSGYVPESTPSVSIKPLDEVSLEEYSNIIGKKYKSLPENTYSFSEENFNFSSSESYKKGSVILKTNLIRDLINSNTDPSSYYILPIELIEKSGGVVNKEKRLLIISPSIVTPKVDYFIDRGSVSLTSSDTEKEYEFRLQLPFISPWDFECEIEAIPGSVFDSNQFLIENSSKVIFKKGTTTSEPVKIKIYNVGDYVGKKNILPLHIKSVSKQGIEIPKVPFNLEVLTPDGPNKITLTSSMLSTNAQEPTEGPIADMVDGVANTFFHSAWSIGVNGNHYFQIDLGKEVSKVSFSSQNRHNGNGGGIPRSFVIKVSKDGSTWTELEQYSEVLPFTTGAGYDAYGKKSEQTFRYFRFEVISNKENSKFFNFAEFDIYAK